MTLKNTLMIAGGILILSFFISPTPIESSAVGYSISGTVTDQHKKPVSGAMITAFDAAENKMTTVFTKAGGRFKLPGLAQRDYKLRARLPGFEDDSINVPYKPGTSPDVALHLKPTANPKLQQTSVDRVRLIKWPNEAARLNFVMACAYCHQIGTEGFRGPKEKADWEVMVKQVMGGRTGFNSFRLLHKQTQDALPGMLHDTFKQGAEANWPAYTPPPPPSGEALNVVITEWPVGPENTALMHDLEIGDDGLIYLVDMVNDAVRSLDPKTGDRKSYSIPGGIKDGSGEWPTYGPHSIEKAPNGDMWITLALGGKMAKFDPKTRQFQIIESGENGKRGSYPHTLRFDQDGICWYTDAASNSIFRLDPKTLQIKEYKLLKPLEAVNVQAMGESGGITPYGIDIGPDGKVWYTKLNGQRVGVIDPATGKITEWKPPVHGPRRLEVGADGVVWIPGYASGDFCSFNPKAAEKDAWKVYPLPGAGHDIPYALNVDRRTGQIWICGAGSDTMMRFDPKTEKLTVYPMPTRVTYTREVEFGKDGSVWTVNSNHPARHIEGGRQTVIKIEVTSR
ncbi:MAG TPA: carboxypeptidase regulatory-like domain-containing protein [Blastocatellia bacterium]|nr:carboxypeptidase regulatory-like domain-containing protein [Blastocatellia bacterium]